MAILYVGAGGVLSGVIQAMEIQKRAIEASADYRIDARLKCGSCRGWMRRKPTAKTPLTRAPVFHADLCKGCDARFCEQYNHPQDVK